MLSTFDGVNHRRAPTHTAADDHGSILPKISVVCPLNGLSHYLFRRPAETSPCRSAPLVQRARPNQPPRVRMHSLWTDPLLAPPDFWRRLLFVGTCPPALIFDPAATLPGRSVSTRTRLPDGTPRTNTTASCARPAKASSAVMAAELPPAIASLILPTAPMHQPATSRHGMARSSRPVRVEKNRNPSYRVGHPVLPRRTYGRPGMGAPYVLPRRT
jgi:hypothetical protein